MVLVARVGDEVVAVSSTYGDKELPIYCVDTEENKISISFDAAWGAEDFSKIMEILDKHEVKTTFFMTGEWVEKYPDCVKTLVEKDSASIGESNYCQNTAINTVLSVYEKKANDAGITVKIAARAGQNIPVSP